MVARGAFGANAEAEPARARAARVRRGAMVYYWCYVIQLELMLEKQQQERRHEATTNVGKKLSLVELPGYVKTDIDRNGKGRRILLKRKEKGRGEEER